MTFNTALAEEVLANFPNTNLPCLEYEWGCPNYGDDQSRWCDNCRARTRRVSRPRCMCHNKYLPDCPNSSPREAELKTEISNQLASTTQVDLRCQHIGCPSHHLRFKQRHDFEVRKGLPRDYTDEEMARFGVPCKKHGHRSRGKAEAQLRSLLRRQLETNYKGDASTLEVYKCRRVECRDHPWHVGHNPYVRREI